jgi:hypothetical protein
MKRIYLVSTQPSELAKAIRDSTPGTTIVVRSQAELELGKRAAKRLGKSPTFTIGTSPGPST